MLVLFVGGFLFTAMAGLPGLALFLAIFIGGGFVAWRRGK